MKKYVAKFMETFVLINIRRLRCGCLDDFELKRKNSYMIEDSIEDKF